ncbi:Uncharacterised protein [Mycobacteroides abscessus subsp. abscessus]|nr:Uncharacterised protein [Mycobacteroides abscessus subsp. abscessus]
MRCEDADLPPWRIANIDSPRSAFPQHVCYGWSDCDHGADSLSVATNQRQWFIGPAAAS